MNLERVLQVDKEEKTSQEESSHTHIHAHTQSTCKGPEGGHNLLVVGNDQSFSSGWRARGGADGDCREGFECQALLLRPWEAHGV